jgi:hypothetical protein
MKFPLTSPWVLSDAPARSLSLLPNWIETKIAQPPDEIAFDNANIGIGSLVPGTPAQLILY